MEGADAQADAEASGLKAQGKQELVTVSRPGHVYCRAVYEVGDCFTFYKQ